MIKKSNKLIQYNIIKMLNKYNNIIKKITMITFIP